MSETPSSTTPTAASGTTAAAPALLSFTNIRGLSKKDVGQFKISGDLCGWRNKETKAVSQFNKSQIDRVEWTKTSSREAQLKLILTSGQLIRFDGFKDSDFEPIKRHFLQSWSIEIKKVPASSRGWHWGEYSWDEKNLNFVIDGHRAFDLHAPEMTQITTPTKTDVSIEFYQDESIDPKDDRLVEIRFYVPPAKEDAEVEPLEVLKDDLVLKSGVGAVGTDSVCHLPDIHALVPRGRYDMHLQKTSLQLHGRSTKFNILYNAIVKMYLLPRPNSPHLAFVLHLDMALRQGQTAYKSVVIQFDNRKVAELKLNLSDEEITKLQEKNSQIKREMEGSQYEVITNVMKALTGKQVIIPIGDFQSSNSSPGIRCSNKTLDGHLYPLGKSFIFIPKPVIIIKYDEINRIEFSRTSGNQTRFFEFRVESKTGNVDFTSIDRSEYQLLVDFFKQKGIKIIDMGQEAAQKDKAALLDLGDDDESDDEEFEADEDESDDDESGSGSEEDEEESKPSPKKSKKHKSDSKRS
eukprot:Selendium_serpulae@DN1760_c0_g1_i1.p1